MVIASQCTSQLSLEFGKTCACGCGKRCSHVYLRGHHIYSQESTDRRFWRHVDQNGPVWNGTNCWVWKGSKGEFGHGRFRLSGSGRNQVTIAVHIFTYQMVHGPVPYGLELDHLCRNPPCCNPFHLEAVTHQENCKRGMTLWAEMQRTGLCKRGHDITGQDAFYLWTDKKTGEVHRKCAQCGRDKAAYYRNLRRQSSLQSRLTDCNSIAAGPRQ